MCERERGSGCHCFWCNYLRCLLIGVYDMATINISYIVTSTIIVRNGYETIRSFKSKCDVAGYFAVEVITCLLTKALRCFHST